jgi:hypothetical protein
MTDDKAIEQYREKRRKAAAEAAQEIIDTKGLLHLLQNYIFDRGVEQEVVGKDGKKKIVKNTPKVNGTKLKAIELALNKVVPNVAAVKHDVEVSNMTFIIKTDHEK